MRKLFGYLLIAISISIVAYVLYSNSQYDDTTREFSQYTILTSSWEQYKKRFINPDGRVIDHSQNGITTSEGQSYAMLRAIWLDDKETFDLVWKWTKENLKRPDDNLFGWRWGEHSDNSFGFIPDDGANSATDADQDIALALIFASSRWHESEYEEEAKAILTDMWEINTATAAGERYLIAGNWAQNDEELVLNPSYFAPYAWRIFSQVDTEHDWESLIGPAYALLHASSEQPLDKERAVGLPPDWVVINRNSGTLSAPENLGNLTTNYGYDALRVPWRVGLDLRWNDAEQARIYLDKLCQPLAQDYQNDAKLASVYGHDGEVLENTENPAMYAASLGCFVHTDENIAQDIYQNKIIRLYANDANTFREDVGYYEQNWLWFGAALYYDYLIPYEPN